MDIEIIETGPMEERRRRRSEAHRATTYGRFLNELCDATVYEKSFAATASTVVLNCLEQRLASGTVDHMEAQLTARLRELLEESRQPRALKPRKIHRIELLQMIADGLTLTMQEAEVVARNVLGAVRNHVSQGEAAQVEKQLPDDLREFWWPLL